MMSTNPTGIYAAAGETHSPVDVAARAPTAPKKHGRRTPPAAPTQTRRGESNEGSRGSVRSASPASLLRRPGCLGRSRFVLAVVVAVLAVVVAVLAVVVAVLAVVVAVLAVVVAVLAVVVAVLAYVTTMIA